MLRFTRNAMTIKSAEASVPPTDRPATGVRCRARVAPQPNQPERQAPATRIAGHHAGLQGSSETRSVEAQLRVAITARG